MIIIPSIDILDGKIVRLQQGDYNKVTTYSKDLSAVLDDCIAHGIKRIHLVDLDGAKQGKPCCSNIVQTAVDKGLEISLGGGIRSWQHAQSYIALGVRWLVLGSIIVTDPALVQQICNAHPDRVILGVDTKDGQLATHGWLQGHPIDQHAQFLQALPSSTILHTDVAMDGMMQGSNYLASIALATQLNKQVIVSGGISKLTDVQHIAAHKAPQISGVIVGKAFWEGIISLDDIQNFNAT